MDKHDYEKTFSEYYVKNILKYFNLINELKKDESPDWISKDGTFGLEVTKADETEAFSGFVEKYGNNHDDISKFNKKYTELKGRVFKKTDPVVKALNLQGSPYHEDYIHIIPGYDNNFNYANKIINNKLDKLNKKYKNLSKYYLGVISTIIVYDYDISAELNELNKIQSTYTKKYSIIYVICFNKLLIFNMENNSSQAIDLTDEILRKIAIETEEEIDNL